MSNSLDKFCDQKITAKGEERASVDLIELSTLWFNTGSICNLSCQNCYIESSPQNDRLSFISVNDVKPFLAEINDLKLPTKLIGLTGGEPFANPHILEIISFILESGFEVLVLTNAFKVLKRHKEKLLLLKNSYSSKLNIRVSLDHYTREVHEGERGLNTFDETLRNILWLDQNGFSLSLAGRSLTKESNEFALEGYQQLFQTYKVSFKLVLGKNIVIFPEMDLIHNVPEITTSCWGILSKSPKDQMCASERMIIKKKNDDRLTVMPCTLLAYDSQFELGRTLSDSAKKVYLNHPFCAKFCVLGGASCSPKS